MSYSKIIRIAIILLIPFLLSSCFEIKEEVYLKKNGSGTYKFVMDMSQLQGMIEAMQDKNKAENKGEKKDNDMMSQSKEGMEKAVVELNAMEGISHAKSLGEGEDSFVFGFEFEFASVKALNEAIRSRDKEGDYDGDFYTFKKGVFKKSSATGMDQLTSSMGKDDMDSEQAAQMLGSVTYSFTLRTQGKIKKFTNKEASLKNSKKELSFTTTFKEMLEKKISVENEVKIK